MLFNLLFKRKYHKAAYQKCDDGAYKILVALNKYEDIYSDWDPSPFKKRDIEEDFVDYIWDSALDIPLYERIKVVFLIKNELRNSKKESQVLNALNTHFRYCLSKLERKYFDEKKKSLHYLLIGIVLAILAYSDIFTGVDLWMKVFSEGIVIGTWVFFWEAFYNLFMECANLREEIKFTKRFLETEYCFESND